MVLLINLVVNIDHGVLPGGVNVMTDALDLKETQYGYLESSVFLGNIVGSIVASFLFREVSTKYVLISVLILNALMQSVFIYTTNFYVLLIARILSGSFQVFVTIYWPVWVDAFSATETQKGVWMTLVLLASVFAYVVGYGLVLVADAISSWKIAFYVMIIIVIPFVLWIGCIPIHYLDPLMAPEKQPEEEKEEEENKELGHST